MIPANPVLRRLADKLQEFSDFRQEGDLPLNHLQRLFLGQTFEVENLINVL